MARLGRRTLVVAGAASLLVGVASSAEAEPKDEAAGAEPLEASEKPHATESVDPTSDDPEVFPEWGGTQCEAAHANGQIARIDKRLLRARSEFQRCSQRHCHDEIRRDCITWYEEVERSIPTVVFGVRVGNTELLEFTVSLNDTVVSTGQESTAIELDPGIYQFRVKAPEHAPQLVHARIREGEKNRIIDVHLPLPRPAQTVGSVPQRLPPFSRDDSRAEPSQLRDAITVGLGVVSFVAGGVAIASYVSASSKIDDAEDPTAGCSPACSDEVVQPIRRLLLATDFALATSVLSGGAAISLWLTRPNTSSTEHPMSGANDAREASAEIGMAVGGRW